MTKREIPSSTLPSNSIPPSTSVFPNHPVTPFVGTNIGPALRSLEVCRPTGPIGIPIIVLKMCPSCFSFVSCFLPSYSSFYLPNPSETLSFHHSQTRWSIWPKQLPPDSPNACHLSDVRNHYNGPTAITFWTRRTTKLCILLLITNSHCSPYYCVRTIVQHGIVDLTADECLLNG